VADDDEKMKLLPMQAAFWWHSLKIKVTAAAYPCSAVTVAEDQEAAAECCCSSLKHKVQ
jgi:hypothetical protein